MNSRNSSASATMTPPQPRSVTAGRQEGELYIIVLDGSQEVETTDYDLAVAASNSKREGKAIAVELESATNGGRAKLLKVEVLDQPAVPPQRSEPAKSTAVATRPANTQAVATAPPQLPHGLIMSPEHLAAQLTAMSAHYNVLSPAIAVSQMAPGFGANLAVVQIDPSVEWDDKGNGTGPDTYNSDSIHKDKRKRSLNKNGLQKIAQALGIQWDHSACRRLDDGKERNFWLWKYVGYVRTHDGQLQTVEGSRELDLRDGSAEAAGMKPAQLMKQRAMGNQMCETKAMQRAIRTFVRQAYTVDELRKPFLIVRFSFTPDMSDPEIKKLVTQNAMAGIGALYPAAPASALPALPEHLGDDIDEAMPTIDESTPAKEERTFTKPGGAAEKKADPFADPPAAHGELTVVKVDKRSGRKPGAKRDWHLYTVTFSDGQIAATFSETMHQLIDEAYKQKAPVKVSTSESEGNYDDKLEFFEIIDRRQQHLPMDEEERKY